MFNESIKNDKAHDFYNGLASSMDTQSRNQLKYNATMFEYLNAQNKYTAEHEPDSFRTYEALVQTTKRMLEKGEMELNQQKGKLFAKGYSEAW